MNEIEAGSYKTWNSITEAEYTFEKRIYTLQSICLVLSHSKANQTGFRAFEYDWNAFTKRNIQPAVCPCWRTSNPSIPIMFEETNSRLILSADDVFFPFYLPFFCATTVLKYFAYILQIIDISCAFVFFLHLSEIWRYVFGTLDIFSPFSDKTEFVPNS